MSWGDETEGQTDKFQSKVLPPAELNDTKNNQVIGTTLNAPQASPVAESGGGADLQLSNGKTSWRRRLAPRHRDAVKEYFNNPNNNSNPPADPTDRPGIINKSDTTNKKAK